MGAVQLRPTSSLGTAPRPPRPSGSRRSGAERDGAAKPRSEAPLEVRPVKGDERVGGLSLVFLKNLVTKRRLSSFLFWLGRGGDLLPTSHVLKRPFEHQICTNSSTLELKRRQRRAARQRLRGFAFETSRGRPPIRSFQTSEAKGSHLAPLPTLHLDMPCPQPPSAGRTPVLPAALREPTRRLVLTFRFASSKASSCGCRLS